MLSEQRVRELIEKRFIEPTRVARRLYAGVELEFPLVNLAGRPVDFTVVHSLTERFCEHFSFVPVALDNHGNIYSVACPQSDDSLTYDCSYNNLEFSFGRVDDLCEVHRRFTRYYAFIQEALAVRGHTLTGMGVNPHRTLNRHEPLPTGRYRMLYRFLQSAALQPRPNHFHTHYDFGMFTSASQVQIDVTSEELLSVLRAHELLEPLKAVLFANSVLADRGLRYLCARDMLWEDSMHGLNPRNVGAFKELPSSVDGLRDYIASQSIFCTERDGRYLSFTPTPITAFLAAPRFEGEYFEDGEWHRAQFVPDERDLPYLRSYKFSDLTFRGTIEHRSCCCQPARDALSVAAFHLGLAGGNMAARVIGLLGEDANPLATLVGGAADGEVADAAASGAAADAAVGGVAGGAAGAAAGGAAANAAVGGVAGDAVDAAADTPATLRRQLVRQDWPATLDRDALKRLLLEVLELAQAGLVARGRGEERFLTPLYKRTERLENPAQRMLRLQAEGKDPTQIIQDYATL
jgi:gamma-glutamylcysteine synthetase